MKTPTTGVLDLDLYKYHAAAAGEKRSVLVTHKASGREKEYKTRTEFYGDWRKKEGGALAVINEGRTSPFLWDEFSYNDIQRPEPIENILHTAKLMVEKDLAASGAKKYKAFLGKGESFRVELSTLLKYKDREHLLKPLALAEVTDYLEKKFKAEVVTEIECDDAVVMECYKKPSNFAMIEDKDFWGCPINVWDRNQQERGIVNCDKFGHLFLDTKSKVRGEGRIFLLFQVASQDDTDNYKANCFSNTKWGDKSAYKALVDCKTDTEAWQKLKGIFQYLYPEQKTVLGWRGDEISLTWDYVLNECFMMANMVKIAGEQINAYDMMDEYGVKYE